MWHQAPRLAHSLRRSIHTWRRSPGRAPWRSPQQPQLLHAAQHLLLLHLLEDVLRQGQGRREIGLQRSGTRRGAELQWRGSGWHVRLAHWPPALQPGLGHQPSFASPKRRAAPRHGVPDAGCAIAPSPPAARPVAAPLASAHHRRLLIVLQEDARPPEACSVPGVGGEGPECGRGAGRGCGAGAH